jgi:hypothetical protein
MTDEELEEEFEDFTVTGKSSEEGRPPEPHEAR